MSRSMQIKKIEIGSGIPKICVPIIGTTAKQIISQVQKIIAAEPDLVEWRADYFEKVEDFQEVKEMLMTISDILNGIPLIFTFRTVAEGGERQISLQDYVNLNKTVSEMGLADLIDIEVFSGITDTAALIAAIRQNGVRVIGSNHHFHNTPPAKELLERMQTLDRSGADILKIAVMPRDPEDVLTLLTATNRMRSMTDKPLITMAMGQAGAVSRVSGEFFGSAVTFGCVDQSSAPGQLEIKDLKVMLAILHESIAK